MIPDSIPEIDENSSDDDDDLIGIPAEKVKFLTSNSTSAEDATINSISEMQFKKGHFKKDSSISSTSSSDDDSLSRGLTFPEYTVVDGKPNGNRGQHQYYDADPIIALATKTQTQSLLSSSNILPSIVSGIYQWSKGASSSGAITAIPIIGNRMSHSIAVSSLDSSDGSDFEIIDADDVK